MDLDGDGKVMLAEFRKRSALFHFPVWDTDRNDLLSPTELRSGEIAWATDSRVDAIFMATDADGDGSLSVSEFRARNGRAPMLWADWDEDGTISFEEFSRQNARYHESGRMKRVLEILDRDGDGRLSETEFTERSDLMRFMDKDTNGDAVVDRTEFSTGAKLQEEKDQRTKEFDSMDTDGSGGLSTEEVLVKPGR